jgi:cell division septation protein DedD
LSQCFPQELAQLRQALKQELEVSVAGKIVDVASAWSLSAAPSDAAAPSSSTAAVAPNPYATPSRGPSATDLPGLLNASSFIGVPEYSRMFKGSSPTAMSGVRARPAAGGVVTTSKESMVRAPPARQRCLFPHPAI